MFIEKEAKKVLCSWEGFHKERALFADSVQIFMDKQGGSLFVDPGEALRYDRFD